MASMESTHHLSLTERIQRIRLRMQQEKISGISLENKEAFLAFCQEEIPTDDAKCDFPIGGRTNFVDCTLPPYYN